MRGQGGVHECIGNNAWQADKTLILVPAYTNRLKRLLPKSYLLLWVGYETDNLAV
jgi:hypothetical protein